MESIKTFLKKLNEKMFHVWFSLYVIGCVLVVLIFFGIIASLLYLFWLVIELISYSF